MDQQGTIVTLRGGAYRLREPLATSAYGALWRADGPPGLGMVAIKLVNREQMARAEHALHGCWLDSARNEIAFLGSLAPWDQRHIVRMLDSGMHAGLPALALELLDGDLARNAAAGQPFGRVLDWIAQVNQALGKVHQYGWRYLDLKPANLLLDGRGNLKLADFGTIRALADTAPHTYTGTASWQAPEQYFPNAVGRYDTDARTDYFALGALLYWLVEGEALCYSRECAEAAREGRDELMRSRTGLPASCLLPQEAQRFTASVERTAPGAGHGALELLRALLAPQRDRRPRHALDISRALSRIRQNMLGGQPLRRAA